MTYVTSKTLAVVLGVALVTAIPANAAVAKTGPAGVRLTADFPKTIEMNTGMLTETINLTLKNTRKKTVTLKASNEYAIHLYDVADATGQMVESHRIVPMIYQPQSLDLPGGGTTSATASVTLDTTKYHDADYTLHYTFWGVNTDAKFSVKIVKAVGGGTKTVSAQAEMASFCGNVTRVDPKSCLLVAPSMVGAATYDISGASPEPKIGKRIQGSGTLDHKASCGSAIHLTDVKWQRTEFCILENK